METPTPEGNARLTRVEWLVCIVAAIGFAFDIYELLMLPLVLPGALVTLSGDFGTREIKGAINVPLNRISQELAQFPKDKPFILHCAGGYRSMIAASILKQRGWDLFVDVEGGFGAIKNTDVKRTAYVCPTTML